jgi:uncharacterized damage-inducible protein DinB
MIQQQIKSELSRLSQLIGGLSTEEYTMPIPALSEGSIGAHCRHIIEMFGCLLNDYQTGTVNYDARERNEMIQTVPQVALTVVDGIIDGLNKEDKFLKLHTIIHDSAGPFDTSYFRELWFNFDHCIHHEALIRVGLKHLKKEALVDQTFGVSPSTVAHKEHVYS